jgi:hypothetical protein
MSCVGDNWVVPSANPNNIQGGVLSVGAATPNVTITGTASNPLIGVTNTGGVQTLEGLIGNVNLNGVGMTIAGATPTAQDVTLTAAVQNIVAGSGCTVSNVGGVFTINSTGGGVVTQYTNPDVIISGSVNLNGGGSPVVLGAPFLPPFINPTKNPNVFVVLTMSMTGVLNAAPSAANNAFTYGLEDVSGQLLVFSSGLVAQPNYNWGTTIPDTNNFTLSGLVPLSALTGSTLRYKAFMAFPFLGTPPYYILSNMRFRMTFYYIT